jgi:hypothetical protein
MDKQTRDISVTGYGDFTDCYLNVTGYQAVFIG